MSETASPSTPPTSSGSPSSNSASDQSDFEKNFYVEQVSCDVYRGHQYWRPFSVSGTFGGHTASQAIAAAARTLDGEHCHKIVNSLHSYFILKGNLDEPIFYHVERLQDGRNYSRRTVSAKQNDGTIFKSVVSFQVKTENTIFHQVDIPSDAPKPEDLLTMVEVEEKLFKHAPAAIKYKYANRSFPELEVDFRDSRFPRDPSTWQSTKDGPQYLWIRIRNPLSRDDAILHQCAVAYLTDFRLGRTTLRRHFNIIKELNWTSLDHSLWYHAPVSAGQWLLYVMESPSASSNRGLNLGRLYSQDGTLLLSSAQESSYRISKL